MYLPDGGDDAMGQLTISCGHDRPVSTAAMSNWQYPACA